MGGKIGKSENRHGFSDIFCLSLDILEGELYKALIIVQHSGLFSFTVVSWTEARKCRRP
jgi:hypothetical protein